MTTIKTVSQYLWRKRTSILSLVLIVLILHMAVTPPKAHAIIPGLDTAAIIAALGTIQSVLDSVIGGALRTMNGILSGVQSVMNAIMSFFNEIVYPRAAIARAQGLIGQIMGIYNSIRGVMNLQVNSATLANPMSLEALILSKNAGSIGGVSAAYGQVYQTVPAPSQASREMRDLIDMTDAQAQAAMKRSMTIDQIAETTMDAADQVSAELAAAAPGTAPMVEASAVALLVRAHANTQAAMAELMRVRAISLANDSAALKMNAAHSDQARKTFSDALNRR